MRTMIVGLLVGIAGCGSTGDPGSSPFAVGQDAVTYSVPVHAGDDKYGTDNTIAMSVTEGEGVHKGFDFVVVPVGTKVRVADDPGTPDESREIRVKVLEGKHADRVGTIERKNLRPLPR